MKWIPAIELPPKVGWYHTNLGLTELGYKPETNELLWLNGTTGHVRMWLDESTEQEVGYIEWVGKNYRYKEVANNKWIWEEISKDFEVPKWVKTEQLFNEYLQSTENKRNGRRLIGEFMNVLFKYGQPGYYDWEGWKAYKYDEDWEALIPVIKKIQESYQGEELHLESCDKYDHIERMLLELDIEWTWQAVVQFLEWLNNQKSNQ